jgi:hypothetical protein
MGKMFQNASSLKPLGQLKPSCPGIIIWRSSKKFGFFMLIRNPRWLPMQDIVLTQYHIGKYRKNLFLKNYWAEWTHSVHEWSLNGLIKFVFFVMIWNLRWPPPQVIVLTQDHMGKYRNFFFSEAIALIEPKLCINQSLEGPLQTLCFFMLIGIPRWLPLQDIVFT